MKATELRIGNYVWEEYGGVYEVVNINSKGYPYLGLRKPTFKAIGSYDIGVIKPIPLTEEWLVKFGFEQTRLRMGTLYYEYNEIRIDNPFDLFFALGETLRNNRCVEIKYVHQLQNLYHALTGEELTIKTK